MADKMPKEIFVRWQGRIISTDVSSFGSDVFAGDPAVEIGVYRLVGRKVVKRVIEVYDVEEEK